eukprot:TRINITY_DN64973_c0_g1_i1.p1 TRINITY_DN64973_c0_g1~~TRINITY_DN64973_c0_g1_i1.p1  ORF type:complete len:703 (+),score=233.24 TRINITY_DN64973_c0_g1_i1:115-2109(+)
MQGLLAGLTQGDRGTAAATAAAVAGAAYVLWRQFAGSKVRKTKPAVKAEARWAGDGGLIEVEVQQPSGRAVCGLSDIVVDLYGPGVPSVARLVLPLAGSSPYVHKVESRGSTVTVKLGVRSVKRDTVLSELEKLERAGNQPLVLELLRDCDDINPEPVVQAAFRPSKLRSALRGGSTLHDILEPVVSSLEDGLRYRPGEKTMFGCAVRWLACPLLSIAAVWALWAYPERMLELLPRFPTLGWSVGAGNVAKILPPVPETLLGAFQLGAAWQRLQQAFTPEDKAAALAAAAEVAGRPVTEQELGMVLGELTAMLQHRGLLQRVRGFFTFVNVMWLVGISGITVTIGPVVIIVTRPLRAFLGRVLARLGGHMRRAIVWTFKNIILPGAVKCHEYGVFEALAHYLAVCLTAHGFRMEPGPGMFVTLSGLIAVKAATFYSTFLWGRRLLKLADRHKSLRKIIAGFAAAFPGVLCAPMAIAHQSQMLGTFTVMSYVAAFGFFVSAPYHFVYVAGWDTEDECMRTSIASLAALVTFCLARYTGVGEHYLAPFSPGVSVVGGITHYIAQLIIASTDWRRGHASYFERNLMCVASLLGGQLFGWMYGMTGLANTSTTFFVLYLAQKYDDTFRYYRWARFPWFVFSASVGLYYGALWLHKNPAYVTSMVRMLD